MNRIHCNVIRDLLPLYIDGACSQQTVDLVKEHLETCAGCGEVHAAMAGHIPTAVTTADLDGRRLFRHARKTIFGIIIALTAMISCLVINAGGAWEGGPASIGELITTVLYCVFWGVFTMASRNIKILANVSFVISLLSTISALNGLFWKLLGRGGLIAAFISIFTSVPFYGFRFFLDWPGLYAAASVLSLGWLVYTGINLRKIEKQLKL